MTKSEKFKLPLTESDKRLLNEDLTPYFDQLLAKAEAEYQAQQEKNSSNVDEPA